MEPETSTCSNCKACLPSDQFYVIGNGKPHTYCKACVKLRSTEWKIANRERHDANHRRWRDDNANHLRHLSRIRQLKRYGLDQAGYDAMIEVHGYHCWICNAYIPTNGDGKYEKLCVDHDHDTKRVRGLLCSHCNLGLGSFKSDRHVLENAIRYLDNTTDWRSLAGRRRPSNLPTEQTDHNQLDGGGPDRRERDLAA